MGRSFTMLETGKSFLVPRYILFYKSCLKLVTQLCVGSQDETLSTGSPEGHVPSCHIRLQHCSFFIVPSCNESAAGCSVIAEYIQNCACGMEIDCLHSGYHISLCTSKLVSLSIYLFLGQLSQLRKMIYLHFLTTTAHKGAFEVVSQELGCISICKCLDATGTEQETKATLVVRAQHWHCMQFRGLA